jgi:hypothetical protein
LAVLTAAIAAPSAQAFHLKYNADLDELNNSGVNGEAELEFLTGDGDRVNLDAGEGPEDVTDLQVGINATGLEPNMLHPQHIHGFDDASQNAVTPPPTAAGDDGVLSVADGAPFYGRVRLPLLTSVPSDSPPSFPTAPGGH